MIHLVISGPRLEKIICIDHCHRATDKHHHTVYMGRPLYRYNIDSNLELGVVIHNGLSTRFDNHITLDGLPDNPHLKYTHINPRHNNILQITRGI